MPIEASIFRIFIASSNDLEEERAVIRETIHQWNEIHAFKSQVYLDPVLYQSRVRFDSSKAAQSVINTELLDSCDLMIALFWKRLGTPTTNFKGGTLEELNRFRVSGKPMLLCFKESYGSDITEHLDDLVMIRHIKKQYQDRLTLTFHSIEELRKEISRQVALFADKFGKNLQSKQLFSKKEVGSQVQSQYEVEADVKRLELQMDFSREGDLSLILPSINRQKEAGKASLRVLDFGCGNAATTFDRFKDVHEVTEVVGLDIDNRAILSARERCKGHDKFRFVSGHLKGVGKDLGLFDIVFASYVLDHVSVPKKMGQLLWDHLSASGDLIIKSPDDGLKLTHPSSRDMEFIMEVAPQLRGSSNRYFGREIYELLRRLKPEPVDILIKPEAWELSDEDAGARERFFHQNHGHRLVWARKLSEQEGGFGPDTEMFYRLDRALEREMQRFRSTENIFSISVQIFARATKA